MGCGQPNYFIMNVWYIIPAREGSKGLPYKNRKLFSRTADTIPSDIASQVIVSSDDKQILATAKTYGFKLIERPKDLASDITSTRDVLTHIIENYDKIESNDIVVLLYLTYPSREWKDVQLAISKLLSKKARSLLCKKEVSDSPYLMMFDRGGDRGDKIIDHDLCRRQDYKKCFVMSHFVGVFYANEVQHLDTNLWNGDTIFMPISNKIDVDLQSDLDMFTRESRHER